MIAKPDAAGMNAERLERIGRHLERRYIQPGKIAGCQVLVARKEHVAYFRSFGLADRERNRPIRPDTIFRIYSMTKPITSVALMQLYEEGQFQLLDPVHRFLPEWRDLQVYESGSEGEWKTRPCERPMTVRDLLMHTSGLASDFQPDHPVDAAYARHRFRTTSGHTLAELIDVLSRIPLRFSPGERWYYGPSTDVCGALVERISGQSFDRFLAERILGPLGMVDTGFFVPEQKRERFAASYIRRPDKSIALFDDPVGSPWLTPPSYLCGAGGLVSTSADYLRFCRMLLRGGELDGARILSRRTLELMLQNHLPGGVDLNSLALGQFGETGFDGIGFGLGFATSLSETATGAVGAGDYYWGGMASTLFWNDPREQLSVIFMTQLIPSSTFGFRGQLRSLVYGALDD